MPKRFYDGLWFLAVIAPFAFLADNAARADFLKITSAHPFFMGFVKFAYLASLGELAGIRIVKNNWQIKGIRFPQRVFVWGLLGILVTFGFAVFSAGIDAVISLGWLPCFGIKSAVLPAFYKSFFLNIMFGFQFMALHRFSDTLIERGKLFSAWPSAGIMKEIDWDNMFRLVGASLFWFWIPAHTFTFSLPAEYRALTAAGLSVCLGIILAVAKRKAKR